MVVGGTAGGSMCGMCAKRGRTYMFKQIGDSGYMHAKRTYGDNGTTMSEREHKRAEAGG